MPNQDVQRVQNALIAIQLVERDLGLDEGALQTPFMDGLTLADRIEPWDMATMFAEGVELLMPEVGQIERGDSGLFYRGYINMVWGDDGHGKSLLIDQVTWVERKRGLKVMILESEELSPHTRVRRWLDESNDRELVTQEDVDGVIVYPVHRKLSPANVQMFASQVLNEDVSVVFIDSLGTMMANMGLNENDAKDCYIVKSLILDPLAAAGAAVVVIDHVTKSEGEKSKSIGSTRKRSMLSGVGFELRADEGDRWSRKKAGHAELRCWKDRQGSFNPGEHVADLWVTPAAAAGYLQLSVEAPDEIVDDEEVHELPAPGRSQDQLLDEFEMLITETPMIGWAALKTHLKLPSQDAVKELDELGRQQGRWYRTRNSTWVVTRQKVAE